MDLLKMIDKENIYKTIYDMEGEKQPYLSLDALNECADYLKAKMESYGFKVREQKFKLEGSDIEFRNIEGSIGDVENLPAAVLTAHYDTVPTSPGANDDAVGVATMIEVGRVLNTLDNPPPLYIVAVTLEENNNPRFFEPDYKSQINKGIRDKDYFFTAYKLKKDYEKVTGYAEGMFQTKGVGYGEGYKEALNLFGESLDKKIVAHFEEMSEVYAGLTPQTTLGLLNRMGSYAWIKEALETNKKIAFNIALDEMGVFSNVEFSQKDLAGNNIYGFMSSKYAIEEEKRIGNFLAVSSNTTSLELANKIAKKYEDKDIDLPYGRVHMPMTFDEITHFMPMALNADHAGFWKHDIPAVFLFDTANARNPYGHSYGDNISILDFDSIEKVAKGVAAALMDEEILKR